MYSESQKDRFTSDLNDAARWFFKSKNSVYKKVDELYHITVSNKRYESLVPFYWNIIDNNAILIHQLSTKIGGTLISVKTDAIVVKVVETGDNRGDYRVEQIPTVFNISPAFKTDYKFELKENKFKRVTEGSRVIQGIAGTGKSFKIKQDIKKLGKKGSFKLLGTTNIAARNIGGITCHRFFGVNLKGDCDFKKALSNAKKYEYIIIDEYSMLNACMYNVLYYVKTHSQVKFILVGDCEQLGPVKESPYYHKSLAFKEIVDFQMEELTFNHRSNQELSSLYPRVMELKPTDFKQNDQVKLHLTKTNNKRIEINDKMMLLDKKKKRKMIYISKIEDDLNSQDVWLMKGTPLVAIKNSDKLGIINSACFEVTELNPLTVKDTDTKQGIVITTQQFQEYFYVGYALTLHKAQGKTIDKPYAIHEWDNLSKRHRYVAISRAKNKSLINVFNTTKKSQAIEIKDTDYERLKERKSKQKRMEDGLKKRREEALGVVQRILKGCQDSYSIEHTGLTRIELLKHLDLKENGKLPVGFN